MQAQSDLWDAGIVTEKQILPLTDVASGNVSQPT